MLGGFFRETFPYGIATYIYAPMRGHHNDDPVPLKDQLAHPHLHKINQSKNPMITVSKTFRHRNEQGSKKIKEQRQTKPQKQKATHQTGALPNHNRSNKNVSRHRHYGKSVARSRHCPRP